MLIRMITGEEGMHVRLLDFSEIQHGGDILNRLQLNFQRLHQAEYLPSQVFVGDASEWPGDKEGRLLLALVLLSRALHLDAAHAHEIFVAWPDHLNCKGYFGATIDNVINEQQWSGNSWAIRGLIEYYLWTGNDKSINMVEDMVHNLYLPAAGKIRTYPVSLKDRTRTGGVGGASHWSVHQRLVDFYGYWMCFYRPGRLDTCPECVTDGSVATTHRRDDRYARSNRYCGVFVPDSRYFVRAAWHSSIQRDFQGQPICRCRQISLSTLHGSSIDRDVRELQLV